MRHILALCLSISLSFHLFPTETLRINKYNKNSYIRHVRMQEQDRVNNSNFIFSAGLEIISNVDNIEVLISNKLIGVTPFESNEIALGLLQVTLRKTGYKTVNFEVPMQSNRRNVIFVEMQRDTGRLVLVDLPPGAKVIINQTKVNYFPASLESGTHRLKISAFGWQAIYTIINITSNKDTVWHYEGKQVNFKISEFKINPKTVSNLVPESLKILLSASSWANGDIRIIDEDQRELLKKTLKIESSKSTINLSSEELIKLPQGEYRVIGSFIDQSGQEVAVETSFQIDSRFSRSPVNMSALPGGLLYAPSTSMLPGGSGQISSKVSTEFDLFNTRTGTSIPLEFNFRLSPVTRLEINGKTGLILRDSIDDTSIRLGMAVSWRVGELAQLFAVNLALMIHYPGRLTDFNNLSEYKYTKPGLHLITPMELTLGRWHIIFAPTIQMIFANKNEEQLHFSGDPQLGLAASTGLYYRRSLWHAGLSASLQYEKAEGIGIWLGLDGRINLTSQSFVLSNIGFGGLADQIIIRAGIEFGIIW